jgi:SAM-dependent methyltransferase
MKLPQYKKKEENYWTNIFLKQDNKELLLNAFRSEIFDYVFKYAKEKSVIVEGGCSTGRFLKALEIFGYKNASGFEIDKKMVNAAKREGLNVKHGSILDIPCKDSSVDLYLELGVLEHFSDEEQKQILKEIRRILRRKGLMIISFAYLNMLRSLLSPYIYLKNQRYKHKRYIFHQWIYSKTAMRSLLEENGFSIVKFYHLPLEPRAVYIVRRI